MPWKIGTFEDTFLQPGNIFSRNPVPQIGFTYPVAICVLSIKVYFAGSSL